MSDVKDAVGEELYGYLDLEAYARDREIDGAFSIVVVPDGVHVIWTGYLGGATMDDLYDGVFTNLRAHELRRWDVLFDPVCQALDDPCALSPRVLAIQTSAGPRVLGVDERVWVWLRPRRWCMSFRWS